VSVAETPAPLPAPYFEDLSVGQVDRSAPAATLTDGMAAVHQSIVGDRLALALDSEMARRVLGTDSTLAHPALVWDLAIGQSTGLTGRVVANLFYRGLAFRWAPVIGDTLSTATEVVALRETSRKAGRAPTGLAALRVRTTDQEGRSVLDFWRCAMLPLREHDATTGAADSLDAIPAELPERTLTEAVATWNLEGLGDGRLLSAPPGTRWRSHAGDVVSSAPELARLTLNVAAVHHDGASKSAERLVYGGHTIGLAAAQASRALPEILTIVAWHSCDHLAPVREGDTLRSEIELERVDPLPAGGALAHLRSRVNAVRGPEDVPVLDWRYVAVVA
jgi:acyl dehydratase